MLFNNSHLLLLLQKWPFWKGWAVVNCIRCNGIFKCTDRPLIFYLFFSDEQGPFFQSVVLEILREWQSNQKGLPSPKSDEENSSPTSSPDSARPPSLATNDGTSITTQGLLPRKRIDSLGWGTPPMDYKGNRNRFPCLHSLIKNTSRVCITVENSPNPSSVFIRLCKYREDVFYCFGKSTFPRKNAKLFVMALIKREILTSREVLYKRLARVISCCFAKKMISKIRIFLWI